MKKINLHQVDAFTDKLFGGNPAGVVTNADGLTDDQMLKIAREMNLSETAFVLTPTNPKEADLKLRFFTPTSEIKFCGHATVGALFQLAQLDMFGLGAAGQNEVRVETNAGVLPMVVNNVSGNGSSTKITFQAPQVTMEPYRLQGATFAQQAGVASSLISDASQILIDTNLNYVYIPTTSLQALSEQTFDFTRIRKNFDQEDIVIFCFFANEAKRQGADLHARGLAPNVGVDEDPFTGSMQAGLVEAAKTNGYISRDQQHIVTEQGYEIGRPGFAEIEHDVASDIIRVNASAVSVFSTVLQIEGEEGK